MNKVIPLPKRKQMIWKRAERNLYLHLQSGIYYTRKFQAGKGRIFMSTGQKTVSAARTAAEQIRSEFITNDAPAGSKGLLVKDLLRRVDDELHKDFKSGDRSKETRSKDATFLGYFARKDEAERPKQGKRLPSRNHIATHFGKIPIEGLDETFFEEWIRWTGRELGRSLLDFSKYLSIICDYAYRKKFIGRKPTFRNPDDGKTKKEVVIYSSEQIQKFWKHASQTLQDLVVLGAENGFRPFENRKLAWPYIRVVTQDGATATIVRFPEDVYYGKKSKGREVQVGPLSDQVLARRFEERNLASQWVFPSDKDPAKPMTKKQISRLWKQMLKAAGIKEKINFGWLRHTFYTTALLEKRMDIAKVSEFGGTSINTLQKRYLKADHVRTAEVSFAMDLGIQLPTKKESKGNG